MVVAPNTWLPSLLALLPPGRAFTREPGTVLVQLLTAIAIRLGVSQALLEDLAIQHDPRLATSLLPDWERLLALPDACTPAGLQVVDRQRLAFQRLVELGGQSRAYFIGLAALHGEPGVTISEFQQATCNSDCNSTLNSQADEFVWRANIPHAALNARWATCESDCNSSLQEYTPSLIECAFKERKPAHTTVIFSYS